MASTKRKQTDGIYEKLRSDILTMTLRPGEDIDEQALAERYGISRTPIREALIKLSADGLVTFGDEPLFATHLAIGARGGIMTTANLFPERWLEIYKLVVNGDFRGALDKQAEMDPLIQIAFAETNPGPLKEILAAAGHNCGGPRLPLQAPSDETKARIRTVLSTMLPAPANA